MSRPLLHAHSNYKGTGKPSPTYYTWRSMRARCNRKTHKSFSDYGGRGIKVCVEWDDSFESFLNDMGEKPDGLSLERKDNNKGYFKDNCEWGYT